MTTGKPTPACTCSASSMRVRERRARARRGRCCVIAVLELLAVLGLVDRLARGADHLDAELLEHALAREVERAVERRLPAHRRQQRVGPLLLDDARHHLPGDRLDVGGVRHLRVGHDRRRIRVHQDHAVALVAQRLARLRARIVELARLADDDRPGADDQDAILMSVRLGMLPALAPSSSRSGRTDSRCRAAPGSPRGGPGSRTPAGRCARFPAG